MFDKFNAKRGDLNVPLTVFIMKIEGEVYDDKILRSRIHRDMHVYVRDVFGCIYI